MSNKWVRRGAIASVVTTVALLLIIGLFVGRNDLHTWQIVQPWNGGIHVVNDAGWYWRGIAKVTTYPRQTEVFCTKASIPQSPGDDSAEVKFNDGGIAAVDWYCRVTTPQLTGEETEEEAAAIVLKQREFHRQFRSRENAVLAVRSHGRDCLNRSGAIMSSSENQAHRKAQFYEAVEGQVRLGYYRMRPVTVRRKDSVSALLKQAEEAHPGDVLQKLEKKDDEKGAGPLAGQQPRDVVGEQSITATDTILAAEIVRDENGIPIIDTPSPLLGYGLHVEQFSISQSEYDPDSQGRFNTKRDALLSAEKSKADAVNQAQQQLTALAVGDREVAETEWKSNEIKAQALIQAEAKKQVATIGLELKEVQGQTLVQVATVKAAIQESLRKIAETEAKIAENDRKAAQIAAEAQEKKLQIAGAASEYIKALWGIQLQQTIAVAEGLEKIQVPDTVYLAADAIPSGKSPLAQALPAMQLLEAFGLAQKPADIAPNKWKGLDVPSEIKPATTQAASVVQP